MRTLRDITRAGPLPLTLAALSLAHSWEVRDYRPLRHSLSALVSAGAESACTYFTPSSRMRTTSVPGDVPPRRETAHVRGLAGTNLVFGLVADPLPAATGRGCSLGRPEDDARDQGGDARLCGALHRLPLALLSGGSTNTGARTEKLEARRASRY